MKVQIFFECYEELPKEAQVLVDKAGIEADDTYAEAVAELKALGYECEAEYGEILNVSKIFECQHQEGCSCK